MGVRQNTAAVIEQGKRKTDFFNKVLKTLITATHADAAATDKQGLPGAVDKRGGFFQLGVMGTGDGSVGFFGGEMDLFFIHGHEKDIRREFQKDRSGFSLGGLPKSRRQIFGDPFNIVAGGGPLGDRFHHVDLVHLLQCAL